MQIGGRAHSVDDVRFLAAAGLPFAEISILDPDVFYDRELPQLRALQQRYGIAYLLHGPEEGNAWEPEVLRQTLLPSIQKLIQCSQELDIRLLTIHFWLDRRFIDETIISSKLPVLKDMAEYAGKRDVQLCIENLSEHPTDFCTAFDAVDCLGMTLDIGHAQLLADRNTTYEFCSACPGRIKHVHVHDNLGGDTPEHDLHLPVGDGRIDFKGVLGALQRTGYDRRITLEVKPSDVARSMALIESIWQAASS